MLDYPAQMCVALKVTGFIISSMRISHGVLAEYHSPRALRIDASHMLHARALLCYKV